MKITVIGASGRVGARVVREAARRGHEVTAVIRGSSRRDALPPGVVARVADASDAAAVAALAAGQDVVVNATRPVPGADAQTIALTRAILDGTARGGARLIIAGGAAVLKIPGTDRLLLDDRRYLAQAHRAIGEASALQHAVCERHGRGDWVYLCPPAVLAPGVRTGRYRRGGQTLLVDADGRAAISMEDLAVALVDEAEQRRADGHVFTVAGADPGPRTSAG